MPAFIHNRAEHILAKNPSMPKSQAFAIATQQSHKLGKSPKGYGTAEGKREARAKYRAPKKAYKQTANPGGLDSPKLASITQAAFEDELDQILKEAAIGPVLKSIRDVLMKDIGGPRGVLQPAQTAARNARIGKTTPIAKVKGKVRPATSGGVYDVSEQARKMGL